MLSSTGPPVMIRSNHRHWSSPRRTPSRLRIAAVEEHQSARVGPSAEAAEGAGDLHAPAVASRGRLLAEEPEDALRELFPPTRDQAR